MGLLTGHGISPEDIDAAFGAGRAFFELPKAVKERYPFNPETYLGWRGPDELETVTGAAQDWKRCVVFA